MTIPRLLIALLLLALLPESNAAEKKKKRPAPVTSPKIEESAITFRIEAPKAEQVVLTGQVVEGNVPMKKDDKGTWSTTLDGIAPGIYEYSFLVDGLRILDPGNPSVKASRNVRSSLLRVEGEQPFDFLDVPHGTVHYHAYQSEAIERFRELRVYTPPGYETNETEYPLLLLQHGHSDTFAAWTDNGKAHWILDNLIADKKAKPMIVVMLDGHPIPGSYGDGRSTDNIEELRKDIIDEVLPMIEKNYRVKEGRKNRAIAGLSMGGLHSLSIGLNELDTFAWIGAFSAAIPEKEAIEAALEDAEETNEQIELLWIACGEDDFLLDENRELIEWLEDAEIEHEWVLTEGDHSWPVWRGYLVDFAAKLFR